LILSLILLIYIYLMSKWHYH